MTSDPLTDSDFDAIEQAVMETVRGRWFLAEYARRNRHADTLVVLAALHRIRALIAGEAKHPSMETLRFDLIEMAKAIARAKSEMAGIENTAGAANGEHLVELNSLLTAAKTASTSILAAAECIQDTAWTLRERGVDAELCDRLDHQVRDVFAACTLQDVTAQRTRKAIEVLWHLEGHINGMLATFEFGGTGTEIDQTAETALLNAPPLADTNAHADDPEQSKPVKEISPAIAEIPKVTERVEETAAESREPVQEIVAEVHEENDQAAAAASAPGDAESALALAVLAAVSDANILPDDDVTNQAAETSGPVAQVEAGEPEIVEAPVSTALPNEETSRSISRHQQIEYAAQSTPAAPDPALTAPARTGDPLAAIRALSYEERIALFT